MSMERIKKWLHDRLYWGFPYYRDFDGFQWTAKCRYCDHKLAEDSQGNWFHLTCRTTLTKVAEEARRECEIELRTKYIVVSKDVQAQHEQQIIEEARKEERERILNMIPSERRMVHHVIATGSQEDLNDTFRRGYNKCRNQVLEVLSDNK